MKKRSEAGKGRLPGLHPVHAGQAASRPFSWGMTPPPPLCGRKARVTARNPVPLQGPVKKARGEHPHTLAPLDPGDKYLPSRESTRTRPHAAPATAQVSGITPRERLRPSAKTSSPVGPHPQRDRPNGKPRGASSPVGPHPRAAAPPQPPRFFQRRGPP